MISNKERYHQLNVEPHWYALHTRHRHEKRVDTRLKEKSITSYLPLNTVYRRWSDRYKKVEEPLFSCYVFVCMALRDRLVVLQTAGAVNFVSFNGAPARVPEQQIDAIKQVLEKQESVDRVDYPALGTKVKVVRGPLSGLEGILHAIKNSHKLVISIDTVKQAIAVEIDPRDVVSI